MNRHLITLLKTFLGLGLLAWVVWANWEPADGSQGLRYAFQKKIDIVPLMLAGAVCLFSVVMTFLRWYVLVRAQDLPFTVTNALRLGMVGYFLSTFLPGSVGGDIVKAACIAREQNRRTVAVATVILDRVIGLWGLLWLVALLGAFFLATSRLEQLVTEPEAVAKLRTIAVIAVVLALASLAIWLLLGWLTSSASARFARRLGRVPKLGGPLAEFWRAIWMYRCRSGSVALAVGMSVVGHMGFVLTFYFAAQTLSPSAKPIPTLGAHFLLVPIGMAIKAVFPTPGGIGGGEFGFGKLYLLVGAAEADGILASLMQRVVEWTIALAGYLVYLRMKPALQVARKESEQMLATAQA